MTHPGVEETDRRDHQESPAPSRRTMAKAAVAAIAIAGFGGLAVKEVLQRQSDALAGDDSDRKRRRRRRRARRLSSGASGGTTLFGGSGGSGGSGRSGGSGDDD